MNRQNTRILLLLTAFFYLFPLLHAAPCYGLTLEEEDRLGRNILFLARQQFDFIEEPDILQYVGRLGDEILVQAAGQYFTYHFFIVNSKEFNAFAAPSGLIFLHSGLLESMETENELVSVMAHEIAHTSARHLAKRMEQATKVNVGTLALAIAGAMMGGGAASQALIAGSLAAGATLSLQFSRHDEEEADRLGFDWMEAMGRDPAAMERMLAAMRRISRYAGGSQAPAYLLTHPAPETRLGYVQNLLLSRKKKEYADPDPFGFQRFKIRLLSKIHSASQLQDRYARVLENEDASAVAKVFARYGLALIYMEEARYGEARDLLEKVRRFYPDNSLVLSDLGRLSHEEKKYSEALQFFHQARVLDRTNLYASYLAAGTLAATGKSREALALYKDVIEQLPECADGFYRAGMLAAGMGRKGEGFYFLSRFTALKGNKKEALSYLDRALQQHDLSEEMKKKIRTEQKQMRALDK